MDCSFLTHSLFDGFTLAQAQAAQGGNSGISGDQYIAVIVALAILILPFIVGNYLAKALRMPNYGTRFGWILLAVVASAAVLLNRLPGLGVDLRGGTILVYEMDSDKLSQREVDGAQQVKSEDLIAPLTRRINPSGTQEIVIRPYGDSQIEIIVPEVDQREIDRIKGLIEEAGILRFAILANQTDHQAIINLAVERAESTNRGVATSTYILNSEGQTIGLWANVDREEIDGGGTAPLRVHVGNAIVRDPDTGKIVDIPPQLTGEGGEMLIAQWLDNHPTLKGLETLMIVDPLLDVKGEDLAFAASTFDQNGSPAVAFTLTDAGSGKFFALTTNNAPVGSRQRQLGIVLDDNLLSAPNILQPIRKEGRITGRFTRAEVDQLVQILKAGQLPAALTKQPIAENQIDATLGADTIEKGVWAIGWSLLLVLIFILIYYRFAGVIACFALVMNLAMILATMVLINQPLTLPGLAGLVLTVGMSVDANVLIFERIREELKKGAAARMAIRNGFSKATVTIIDANLTTLITAIVLYAIGTDQIRGFAVTLILGILFSMFSAIYVSRTFFDFAERRGFLSLNMSDGINAVRRMLAGENGMDFISFGKLTVAGSAVLVAIGVASLFMRGKTILDIDFAGGSSVQFRVDASTPTDKIREIVKPQMLVNGEEVPYTVNGVSMQNIPANTVYKVDSSFERVDDLKAAVAKAFAQDSSVGLVTYDISIKGTDDARVSPDSNGVMLTAARPQQDGAAEAAGAAEGDVAADTPEVIVTSSSIIELGIDGRTGDATINGVTLKETLVESAKEVSAANDGVNIVLTERLIELTPFGEGASEWRDGSLLAFSKWRVDLPLPADQATMVMKNIEQKMESDPVWISSSSVGARVAGDMIGRAFGALFASLLCIIGYIWFRFQRVIYGFAAVAALVHDVLITLGAIAVSYWLADALGFLLIDPFKISLTVVAAILTIIGYSLNDTIVVFDRIRETKGKAKRLTGEMINSSINQTLSRTLLTSLTTLIVVVLLYWFGGEGIHAFAFALVIGVIAGTYSSVFIASPILLWLLDRQDRPQTA